MRYPERLELEPLVTLDAALRVPGSKSLTNRALIVAALADGVSVLEGGLVADDAEVMIAALNRLGLRVEVAGTSFAVHGRGGGVPATQADLDLRLSGTSIRFLTALVALGRGRFRLDGNARMRQRPIQDLLEALRRLGVRLDSELETGCPPVIVSAEGLPGGHTSIAGERSSQYLSALLMVAPYAAEPVDIAVVGELQSKPFVDMTEAVMAAFGVGIEREGYRRFRVVPARYRASRYRVEGDAMAAGYFWAAAAVTGGRVLVENVGSDSHQGDRRLADVLAAMGCEVRWGPHRSELRGPSGGRLRGGTFDLNDMPDQAQTLAVVALFADGPVRIENVWNLRIKETDRLAALATELRKFGARVLEEEGAITIEAPPVPPDRVEVDTYGDHRMAMAFAVAGARLPGVVIRDPACVAKTYPTFFDDWRALGAR